MKDLEAQLKHSYQIAAIKDAERLIDRWFEEEQRAGREVPVLDASTKTAVVRIILSGKYIRDAIQIVLAKVKFVGPASPDSLQERLGSPRHSAGSTDRSRWISCAVLGAVGEQQDNDPS